MKNEETTAAEQAATVAEQASHVAPEKGPSKKGAAQKKRASRAKKSAKATASKKAAMAPRRAGAQKAEAEPRTNKKAEVLALMKRRQGCHPGRDCGSRRGGKNIAGTRGSSASSAARAARRSNPRRAPPGNAPTASQSSQLARFPFKRRFPGPAGAALFALWTPGIFERRV